MFKKLLLVAVSLVAGCQQPDYAIVTGEKGETVYIEVEVEGETVYVEVPEYIEVEVPVEHGDIWIDSFNQPATVDGIDILWVIDTSGSMNRFDPQLMAGIEAMLLALPSTSWRLAMISNDPMRAVTESQFPLVPGDDILDAEAMYSAMGRGGFEEGFDAVYEYMVNNAYSSTWMRNDAALLVVFVSDEQEQSNSHFINTNDFISWYGSQRAGSVFLASIVNHDSTESLCDYVSPIDVGTRYMDATNAFGGNIIDICDEDWSAGVADATSSVEPHEKWKLTHVPDPQSSIRVFINGVLNNDWYYDPTDNTVYFTVIPSGSDLVEIGYLYYDQESKDTGDTGQ